MGKIFLNRLRANAIIGTLPDERVHRQSITLDIEISTDMRPAAQSDDLYRAVDYSAVEKEVITLVENSSFQLLEALIMAVGSKVSSIGGVKECKVRIDKPQASFYGDSVTVEAQFCNGEMLP